MHPVLLCPAFAGFGRHVPRPVHFHGGLAADVQVLVSTWRLRRVLPTRVLARRGVCKLIEQCGHHLEEWMIAAHDGKSWPQRWFRALWFDFVVSSLSGD